MLIQFGTTINFNYHNKPTVDDPSRQLCILQWQERKKYE